MLTYWILISYSAGNKRIWGRLDSWYQCYRQWQNIITFINEPTFIMKKMFCFFLFAATVGHLFLKLQWMVCKNLPLISSFISFMGGSYPFALCPLPWRVWFFSQTPWLLLILNSVLLQCLHDARCQKGIQSSLFAYLKFPGLFNIPVCVSWNFGWHSILEMPIVLYAIEREHLFITPYSQDC